MLATLTDSKGNAVIDHTRGERMFPSHKPALGHVNVWESVYTDENTDVQVLRAFDPDMEFFRVLRDGKNIKTFYGESAWSDGNRYVSDLTGDYSVSL